METVGCASFSDYLDHLEVQPDEFQQLFKMLLINVTGSSATANPGSTCGPVLPDCWRRWRWTSRARVERGLRRGQEAYTVAMVFAELLGIEHSANG